VRRTSTNAIIAVSILLFVFSVSTAFADGPSINLPPGEVDAIINQYPYPNSYLQLKFSNVPDGYDVSNGLYDAWCVDEDVYIYKGKTYKVRLYSSYDPANPYPDPDWDKVNYILNHKQGTSDDVQAAIWCFIDGGVYPDPGYARDMVDEANHHGEGFVPGPTQILAVVCWIDEGSVQTEFIEWTVPINSVIPEYPIGPILGSVSFVIALGLFRYRHDLPTVFRFKRD
jgi:hypothetical protein